MEYLVKINKEYKLMVFILAYVVSFASLFIGEYTLLILNELKIPYYCSDYTLIVSIYIIAMIFFVKQYWAIELIKTKKHE